MQSIVPIIFLLFWVPGIVHGFVAGTFKESKDVIMAMSKTMETMAYYLVMAFFCALFIKAFGDSNLGILLAMKGANFLQAMAVPGPVTLVGIIILVAIINLFRRFCQCEMVIDFTNFRTHADATGHLARLNAGRLPCW